MDPAAIQRIYYLLISYGRPNHMTIPTPELQQTPARPYAFVHARQDLISWLATSMTNQVNQLGLLFERNRSSHSSSERQRARPRDQSHLGPGFQSPVKLTLTSDYVISD